MSRLTREVTAKPVSQDQILRRKRGQGNICIFPCSADHEQDWQLYPVDLYSCHMLLLLFLTFSVLVVNPKKSSLHGGQSRSWSAEQEEKKKKCLAAPSPPPPLRCSLGENEISKSRDASTCLGATTQVGVTQISVRLASVRGFLLRLIG